MFNEIVKKIEWDGKTLELRTGKIARQADGAVLVTMGDSVVLCTTVSNKEIKEGVSFFPLTVHYREMAFAAGKIPGGFLKREGRGSEREVLVSRLIDRPIRPLFHSTFFNETQVICTVLSYDPECNTDILAIIGSSAALALSGVPYLDVVAASRVGLVNEKFVLNPSSEILKNSKLDLVVAGTSSAVMMVESEADLLSEAVMLEAIKFGHEAFQPVIQIINELVIDAGKPKWEICELFPATLKEQIRKMKETAIRDAFTIDSKHQRMRQLQLIISQVVEEIQNNTETQFSELQIKSAFEEVEAEVLRNDLLEKKIRIDGRKPTEIRQIDGQVALLPKAHGSALFTRGETQGLVVVTLGTSQDEQIIDGLEGEYKESLMLNYIFPPYSVGESTPLRAPGRREVGHGKLAWRALNRVVPTKEQFPYSIRIVSEITESNGSSSMATVCGASMALMDAGVPIKEPVSGIAMGLVKENGRFIILSDILGDEDHLGDMDFKVAGGHEGITALQMDIKVNGITFEIMEQALAQAKIGRIHILEQMCKTIASSSLDVSQYAPVIKTFKIDKDKIREVIGPGGKVIREICDSTGVKIDIADDGTISVSAVGKAKIDAAITKIAAIAFDPQVGDVFDGTVVKILEAGAFVNYLGNRDGFVHISEISHSKIKSVEQVLSHGEVVKVKIVGFDNKGKAKLTIKNVSDQIIAAGVEEAVAAAPATVGNNIREDNKDNKQPSNKKWQQTPEEQNTTKERKYFT
ncbi:Polyribonucleotide nucleotidyltransferase [Candidatus Trichorickettsia mobilis]|uniref:Polyribonucleotide nucleotidyltransferase n=1 Tax=Candidatus Trichorickettsia mobilis TaxID=1346319 RepID=A0ABZ0UUK6_9RICK|nr:polyribonucleotide nucleotidyltransferase [Candidatus Trichorickettsia mobilis]WPY00777.1 Polyribonucleotide nucleotidyltransferase [Candidatus Trichorickettsia mobilis]